MKRRVRTAVIIGAGLAGLTAACGAYSFHRGGIEPDGINVQVGREAGNV
jgi:2-polyprenyl-6-methoxyphenol hydroxylase-like FAD-dependent oxidoreductase